MLVDDSTIVPLGPILARTGLRSQDMRDVIALWDTVRPVIESQIACAPTSFAASEVRIGAPIARPGKVIAIGFNYPQHTHELLGSAATAAEPVVFIKPSDSVSGPNDPVIKPPETSMLDYEVELAVVIGRAGRRISPLKAMDHVMGYVVANDITARDVALGAGLDNPLQLQIARGKGFPTFCPTGPWLVTSDEVPTPDELRLQLRVNGTVRQDDTAGRMLVSIADLIASVSASMALEPGDLILTGTPAGCGFQLEPPSYLCSGDEVLASISGLGEMSFVIQDEQI
ncbi:fumarylacetoacetate hydrolase family protein [Rhodococcus sp. NPDC127530]|uniref:fumarylacetoacetate hydrolase family protein n=1 Tax=unclassified Rhodococcus (in: high G+C Gram-positive bacteria) TaxID=192944 RepID=UPI003642BDF0